MRNTRRNYRDRGRRVCVCGGGPKFRTHGARERTDVRSDDRRWRVTTHRARRLTNGPTRARSSSCCRWCLAACTVAARRSVCACVRARAALPSLASVRPARRSADRPRTTRQRRAAAGALDSAALGAVVRTEPLRLLLPRRYRTQHTHTHTHTCTTYRVEILLLLLLYFSCPPPSP